MKVFLTILILCILSNGIYSTASPEIDMMLNVPNKPAIKTIKSEDGDIIDCVDVYKQPAFDHPALRNHEIQMKPSVNLASEQPGSPKIGSSKAIVSQIWRKTGSCPEGTVPIRRVRREDLTGASSDVRFGRKAPHRHRFLDRAQEKPANFSSLVAKVQGGRPENRSEAFLITVGFNYIGARADINIWNPRVEPGDYSSGQIWMFGGPGDNFESVEAGWTVNPGIFRDSRTRFFAYWTKDAYKTTGCFNLLCSGFVQTSPKLVLGGAIEPVSGPGGQQYQLPVGIFQDAGGNWWLHCGDTVVGYWPRSLFSYLSHSAIVVQWGGEVYSPNVRKAPHTKTAMGSGDWAYNLWQNACYMTNLRFIDYSSHLKFPEIHNEYSDEYDCYSTRLHRQSYMSEPFFYFGGPGQNTRCP